jgi:hypothetical protein
MCFVPFNLALIRARVLARACAFLMIFSTLKYLSLRDAQMLATVKEFNAGATPSTFRNPVHSAIKGSIENKWERLIGGVLNFHTPCLSKVSRMREVIAPLPPPSGRTPCVYTRTHACVLSHFRAQ